MRISCIVVLMAFFASHCFAFDMPKVEKRTFTAKVADISLSAFSEKGVTDEEVSVTAPSIIFSNPLRIDDVRKVSLFGSPEIDTFVRFRKTLCEGSPDEIVSFWAPKERKGNLEIIYKSNNLDKVHNLCNANPQLTIIGLIFQKDTTAILLKCNTKADFVCNMNLVKENERFFLTRFPSNKQDLAII